MRACIDCTTCPATKGPRCAKCSRKKNKKDMAALRLKRRKESLSQNPELEKRGQRICSYCFHTKVLSEFSTSMPNRQGTINGICDRCLCSIYKSTGVGTTELDYKFWRRKAYSCNSVARAAKKRRLLHAVSLADLDYECKPQDLIALASKQDYKCAYCGSAFVTSVDISVDHKIPISREGPHSLSNLALSCRDCNHLKHTRTDLEFLDFVQEYTKRFSRAAESTDKEPSS